MRGGQLQVEVEARWWTLGSPLSELLGVFRGLTWRVMLLAVYSSKGVIGQNLPDVISLVKP